MTEEIATYGVQAFFVRTTEGAVLGMYQNRDQAERSCRFNGSLPARVEEWYLHFAADGTYCGACVEEITTGKAIPHKVPIIGKVKAV